MVPVSQILRSAVMATDADQNAVTALYVIILISDKFHGDRSI